MKKSILLLMPAMFDLQNQVQRALKELDFDVDYIEDTYSRLSPLLRQGKFKPIKRLYNNIFKPNKKKFIKEGIFNSKKKYDYFLCVDGFSLDKSLLSYLKGVNPNIKTILYLYDSVKLFDFTNYFSLFDKVYTFDYDDSQKYNINLLPLFWDITSISSTSAKDYTYDLFFVGKLHSDRFRILNRIVKDAENKGLKTFIKIYVSPKTLSYYIYRLKYSSFSKLIYKLMGKGSLSDIITYTPIPKKELDQKMAESLCVIDIEIPCQSGLSNRLIQTLAMNKKLLTTNHAIKNTNLYNEAMIDFIDRENPFVPTGFIKKENVKIYVVDDLRIDNWLRTLLQI